MRKQRIALALSWVLAAACAPLGAAPRNASSETGIDVGARWTHFLESAELSSAMDAYDALPAVGYDGTAVDAARCGTSAKTLADALDRLPVSVALRRAAYLCAEATNDGPGAERALAELAALSSYVLREAPEDGAGRPIRVMAPIDAEALVDSIGLEWMYSYSPQRRPARYFPLVIAARDPDTGRERQLSFDYVDSQARIARKGAFAGFPVERSILVDAYIDTESKDDVIGAVDRKAVNEANDGPAKDRVATLRGAASRGGIEAARSWLLLCDGTTDAHCADGLVDALLPQAEKQHALPMVFLALAYLDGVGIDKDANAAWTLLDAAARHWPSAHEEFARQWFSVHGAQATVPAELERRLAQLSRDGSRYPERVRILRKMVAKAELTSEEVAFLADPKENVTGFGKAMLAQYEDSRHHPQEKLRWLAQAAEEGDPASQAEYGFDLLEGEEDVTIDKAKGRALLESAAQGGAVNAGRYLGWLASRDGKWKDAEGWLMAPGMAGDEMATLNLAELYENERPGINGKIEQAVTIYREMAGNGSAEARRRLARMAFDGRGMAKDPEQGRRWLLQDAEKNDPESMVQLAGVYATGGLGNVDMAEAIRWMERAVATGNKTARDEYGSLLYHLVATPDARGRALILWQQGADQDDNVARNNLAWALCTSAYPAELDARRGLAIAKAMGKVDALPVAFLDTLAACHAAAGEYERGAELQQQVIVQVEPLLAGQMPDERKRRLQDFHDRLALYRAHKPYRVPPPAAQSDASKPNNSVSLTSSPTK
jgi:TPR repeat protein